MLHTISWNAVCFRHEIYIVPPVRLCVCLYYRCTRMLIQELLTTVEGILPQTGMSSVRKPISTREMLAATLQYLAKGAQQISSHAIQTDILLACFPGSA